MIETTTPVFIFSLPRSGSTLLQRLLMTSNDISSISEPWLLLSLFYINKNNGVISEYSHLGSFEALQDFIENLPGKEKAYHDELRKFVVSLYNMHCKDGEKYFLDKTPRYYLIIPEILKTFPNSKFIFLFRNPIHILSSIIQTWGSGTLKSVYRYNIDVKYGPGLLSEGLTLTEGNAISLKYEDLVTDPEIELKKICEYLNVDFDLEMLNNFALQKTNGKFGDPTGIIDYKMIEQDSLIKWKRIINTKAKVKYLETNIRKLDSNVFEISGYCKETILNELKQHNKGLPFGLKDYSQLIFGRLILKFKLNIIFGKKINTWQKDKLLS